MFDLATRPQVNTASIVALAGVPFDLRLAPPTAEKAFPYTDYLS